MKRIFLLCIIFNFAKAQLPTVCFKAPVTYTTSGVNQAFVISDDFNSDGNKDLAITSSTKVSILLGIGGGNFSQAVSYTTNANSQLTSIAAADFNNDGKLDLVASDFAGVGCIYLLFGSGTGTFGTPQIYPIAATFMGPWSLTVADFNIDGKADIAIANYHSNNISILLGLGTGSFNPVVYYATAMAPVSITRGDFNGDGNMDLATANYSSTNVSVLLGTASGTFLPVVNYPSGGTAARGITTADFNNDGHLDLATANSNSSNTSILFGSATGTFSPVLNYSLFNVPRGITSGDFNGDNKKDIALIDWGSSSNNIAVLLSSGTGSFSPAVYFSTIGGLTSINAQDLNSDNKTDLIVVNDNFSNDAMILFNGFNFNVSGGAICSGQSFTINPNGANTYTYSTGNAVNTPTINTSYTVTATNSVGCVSSAIVNVTVNTLPIVNAVTSDSIICRGQSATLTTTGANSYTWNTTATSSAIVVSPTVTTNYTVSGIDGNGCENFATITQSVSLCTVIAKFSNTSTLTIYPNPNNGDFIISGIAETNFSITNNLGQIVKTFSINALNNYKVSLTDLPNGIYFITSSENKEIKQKIVVSK